MARSLTRARVGRFELLHRFAIGGMGEIFLARERGVAGFDRQVVVKLLISELAEQPDIVTLFIDEARIAAHLAHPNIVQIYDFGRDDSGYFLAMEYVPGQNLARICARASRDPRGLLTQELAVHVVAEMARGLDYAHNARDSEGKPLGIVHRDVSPHNLLLSIHGEVKVMDFGIAKAANTLHRTATGVVRGKFGYMSPEQLAGEPVDVTTDIYSAGIVLWELTMLRRLWPGADDLAILDQARVGNIPRPRDIDPSYPADLEEIVMHAVARDRTQRHASAAALAADLRGWLALHGAVIERSELGAVVKTLFPEIDHETPVRPETPEPHTASLPKPTTTTTPAMPLSVSPAPSQERTSSRSKRGLIALVSVAAVAGGAFAVTSLVGRDDATPSTTVAQATFDAPAAQGSSASPPPPVVADASVAIDPRDSTVDSTVGSAGSAVGSAVAVAPSNPRHKSKKDGGTRRNIVTPPVESRGSAATASRGSAASAPPPELGWLVVEVTSGWGTLSVPGQGPLTTPQKLPLPPGSYPIAITFSEGGATIRATAKVTANATTKCRGTPDRLSCGK